MGSALGSASDGDALEAWLDRCPMKLPPVLRAGILAMLRKR